MMFEFSVVPIGAGASVSPVIARIMKVVIESGVKYKANPMGTVLEGEWDAVMSLIKRCQEEARRSVARVVTSVKIDDYEGKEDRLETKLESVERKLGRTLNR